MKKAKDRREWVVCLKLTKDEYERIRKLAAKHEGGNVSAWIRRASLLFTRKQ